MGKGKTAPALTRLLPKSTHLLAKIHGDQNIFECFKLSENFEP